MFDSHSSPPLMSESVPIYENSMDSIPADKVLKKTRLHLQRRFLIYHACPKCLAALLCGSASSKINRDTHQDTFQDEMRLIHQKREPKVL